MEKKEVIEKLNNYLKISFSDLSKASLLHFKARVRLGNNRFTSWSVSVVNPMSQEKCCARI